MLMLGFSCLCCAAFDDGLKLIPLAEVLTGEKGGWRCVRTRLEGRLLTARRVSAQR